MAPLRATLAAGVAVGLAVALTKVARERRAAPLPKKQRRLGLRSDEDLAQGLRRMALGQVEEALELLDADGPLQQQAVHETRKALKRLRALVRLLRGELGESAFARENAALREVAKQLSGARDAEVMLSTLDALIARHPHKLTRHKGVSKLRRELLAERRRMATRTLSDGAMRAQAIAELRAFRARVPAWSLAGTGRDGTPLVQPGLLKLYTQGRVRFRRARRGKGKDAQAMHQWRKRVKDLRYVAEMLERDSRSKRRRRGADARLHRLAKRADVLGETLGEDHDLAVLAERLRASGKRRGARKLLLRLIARRRAELRRRALRDGARLYRRGPKQFVKRLS